MSIPKVLFQLINWILGLVNMAIGRYQKMIWISSFTPSLLAIQTKQSPSNFGSKICLITYWMNKMSKFNCLNQVKKKQKRDAVKFSDNNLSLLHPSWFIPAQNQLNSMLNLIIEMNCIRRRRFRKLSTKNMLSWIIWIWSHLSCVRSINLLLLNSFSLRQLKDTLEITHSTKLLKANLMLVKLFNRYYHRSAKVFHLNWDQINRDKIWRSFIKQEPTSIKKIKHLKSNNLNSKGSFQFVKYALKMIRINYLQRAEIPGTYQTLEILGKSSKIIIRMISIHNSLIHILLLLITSDLKSDHIIMNQQIIRSYKL